MVNSVRVQSRAEQRWVGGDCGLQKVRMAKEKNEL